MNLRVLDSEVGLSWADWLGIGLVLFALVLGSALIYRYAPADAGKFLP